MKFEVIKSTISRTAGRSGLLLKKHSPEILMGAGVIGIITSTVMACRATLKAEEVLDKANHKIEKIKIVKEHADKGEFKEDNYTEQDYKKDLAVVYVQTGIDFVKLYGPSVLVGAASIGCILGSHGIMRKRNLALVAAYKAVEQSFSEYRKRVVDEFGEKKDYDLKHGIKQVKVTEMAYTDENGVKHKAETKTVDSIDPNGISQYARYFDENSSSEWSKVPEYNLTFLKCQQNILNDMLHARGHLFLNEVYDALGLERSQAGAVVGWVKGVGDDFVDFGIFNGDSMATRSFVNGYEPNILLDFNVAGVIYDMI